MAAAHLFDRHLSAEQTGQLYVSDITYVPTDEGYSFLASVLDCLRH
ncbi:MAG: hypothetical protein ACP5VR_04790 [Acidimicrobiales bacterium]